MRDAAIADGFLRRFHARHPGVTARTLAGGRLVGDGDGGDGDGRSSYGALAEEARQGDRVLDLGCGDGHLLALMVAAGHRAERLIGVDLSAAELRAAKARPALAGARLAVGVADALPLGDASVDLVLSHLGFTLMSRIEGVVGELARVLRPGGRFVTMVGGGPKGDDAFAAYLDCLGPVLAREGGGEVPRLGELKARTDAGLAALFGKARGFDGLVIEDVALRLDGPAAAVWEGLATGYEMDGVSAEVVAEVRERWMADARCAAVDGVVRCTMALRWVEVWRV